MAVALKKKTKAKEKLYAKGRLKTSEMNLTEKAFVDHLEALRAQGKVARWWFEAIRLRVAPRACSYTPDFLVLRPDGQLDLVEVKGSKRIFADDAKVKTKFVAGEYPFAVFVAYPKAKKEGGGWLIEQWG
mgnify:CR=1 FL=1